MQIFVAKITHDVRKIEKIEKIYFFIWGKLNVK